jgi:hypothetical protein
VAAASRERALPPAATTAAAAAATATAAAAQLTLRAIADAYGVDIHLVTTTREHWLLRYDGVAPAPCATTADAAACDTRGGGARGGADGGGGGAATSATKRQVSLAAGLRSRAFFQLLRAPSQHAGSERLRTPCFLLWS